MTVPQVFDSLIAKLIVTGASRQHALQRAARALAEFEVGGMSTVLPFHRAVVTDPAFAGPSLRVHTRWIETEFAAAMPVAGVGSCRCLGLAGAGEDHGGGGRQSGSRWCCPPTSGVRAVPLPLLLVIQNEGVVAVADTGLLQGLAATR